MPLDSLLGEPSPQAPASGSRSGRRIGRRLFSSILSLLVSGGGQAYNGNWKKGAFFAGISIFNLLCLCILRVPTTLGFGSFLTLLIVGLVGTTWSVADAFKNGATHDPRPGTRGTVLWKGIVGALAVFQVGSISWSLDSYLDDIVGYRAYIVRSPSMEPTLRPGERFVADVKLYRNTPPQRGDIVVYVNDGEPGMTGPWVHRLVAVGGDSIEGRNGKVLLNGRSLGEAIPNISESVEEDFAEVQVPPNHVFVLGDNRSNSYDSRFRGTLSSERVKGKFLFVYYYGTPREDY